MQLFALLAKPAFPAPKRILFDEPDDPDDATRSPVHLRAASQALQAEMTRVRALLKDCGIDWPTAQKRWGSADDDDFYYPADLSSDEGKYVYGDSYLASDGSAWGMAFRSCVERG